MAVEVIELRYEDYGTNNHKFYRAYVSGPIGWTQWGRIGTKGQYKMVGASAARRTIQEKQAKGYDIATPWTTFVIDQMPNSPGDPAGLTAMTDAANRAIGDRVSSRPLAPHKSEAEVEEDFAKQLLALKGRYSKPEDKPAAPAQPEAPKTDPNSIEGRLGAALSAARNAS